MIDMWLKSIILTWFFIPCILFLIFIPNLGFLKNVWLLWVPADFIEKILWMDINFLSIFCYWKFFILWLTHFSFTNPLKMLDNFYHMSASIWHNQASKISWLYLSLNFWLVGALWHQVFDGFKKNYEF